MGVNDNLLVYLGEKGALYNKIELSTIKISREFESSQQTISRKLVELEKEGLIERTPSTRGIKIIFTDRGRENLKSFHAKLGRIFEKRKTSITGIVESGLGEGSYYISLREYYKQFKEKLNMSPFKGTLNLRVEYLDLINLITGLKKIMINGFKTSNRTFGEIISYKVKVNGIKSAIVIPKRTSHNRDIIEIISETNFRKKLNLNDGDKVEVSL